MVDHGLQEKDADGGVGRWSPIYRSYATYEPHKLRVSELHLPKLSLRTSDPR